MVKRFLITTALEETWSEKEPVLFLGDWCQRYSRRGRWSKMDAEVLPYHWDDRKQLYSDYQYLIEFYERLLVNLSAQLNQIHGVNHSLRYWRILIGPWLGIFTQMLFDRWTSIQLAISRYDLSGTIVLADQEESLIPDDMNSFSSFFGDDEWNHHLYAAIIQQFTAVPCVKQVRPKRDSALKTASSDSWKRKVKRTIAECYSRVASLLTRDHDAFFLNTYLQRLDEIRLCRRLREVPKFWPLVSTVRSAVNINQRQWLVAGESHSEFETCAHTLIPQQIPTAYLEGYNQLIKQSNGMPWPKQPKVIWTSNAHIGNDVFKAWTAGKVECGSPLVIGQHGGHYGIGHWSFVEDHELAASDCYLSWGWSEPDQPKVYPVGQLTAKRPLGVHHAEQKRAVMVTTVVPRYSYTMRSFMVSGQWQDFFNDQCTFVLNLPAYIRKELTVRLHSKSYGWNQAARWKDNFPDISLNEGKTNINDLILKSRLYISTYNATTYLESFAMNVPTVIFWNPNHWELRDSAIPYFENLKSVGIFHETPESAARHVAAIWDDVDSWWTSLDVQKAVKSFKERYCRTDNMLDRLEVILKAQIAEGGSLA